MFKKTEWIEAFLPGEPEPFLHTRESIRPNRRTINEVLGEARNSWDLYRGISTSGKRETSSTDACVLLVVIVTIKPSL